MVNSKPHGFSADFWALGVILYELMYGKRPYSGIHRKEYKEKISSTFIQIKPGEQPKDWSVESVDIINGLLQRKDSIIASSATTSRAATTLKTAIATLTTWPKAKD